MRYKASVEVMLKTGVLDPQGATLERALKSMGHDNVGSIRVGKLIELELESDDLAAAEARVEAWADELLANPVMERYRVKVEAAETGAVK
jgi:phosphoribosylformylglycinamidine synthase